MEGAPINYNMGVNIPGSYSNIVLKTIGNGGWHKGPINTTLKGNKLYVSQGTPINPNFTPTVLPSDSMFMFSQNYASPACCPSVYSTDTGCVCTTKEQQDFLGLHRGGNQSFASQY